MTHCLKLCNGRDVYHFLKPIVMLRDIWYNNSHVISLIFAIFNSSKQYDHLLLSMNLVFWIKNLGGWELFAYHTLVSLP